MSNVTNDFNKAREAIEDFAKNIAVELADIRYYEVDRIQAIAATRLVFAIQELLTLHLLDLESERLKLVEEFNNPMTPGWKKEKLMGQLANIKVRLKQSNRLKATFADYNDYRQLKHFIKARFGGQVLDDFQENYLNKGENAMHILKRKQ